MVLGITGSLLLARWIKRQTLGMEPAEIVALAEQRQAVFAGIAEGVIALDTRDRVSMINPLAVRLLSLPRNIVGLSLADLHVEGRLRDVLTGVGGVEQDAVVIRSGRVLVLNRMPVRHDGRLPRGGQQRRPGGDQRVQPARAWLRDQRDAELADRFAGGGGIGQNRCGRDQIARAAQLDRR
jgi:PAS domain-containing protein